MGRMCDGGRMFLKTVRLSRHALNPGQRYETFEGAVAAARTFGSDLIWQWELVKVTPKGHLHTGVLVGQEKP